MEEIGKQRENETRLSLIISKADKFVVPILFFGGIFFEALLCILFLVIGFISLL